jgi:hypothetical protein
LSVRSASRFESLSFSQRRCHLHPEDPDTFSSAKKGKLFKTVQISNTARFTLRRSKRRRTAVIVSTRRYPTWQQPYQTAPIKFDLYKFVDRVRNAETPINSQLRELQTSADGDAERQAITDACNAWLVMQNQSVKCPDSK